MFKEFKEFAMRGSVLDLAVGVIIGAAFGKVVSSLVDDILMPPLGKLIGKVDFSSLYINLSGTHYETLAEAKAHGAALSYGNFINTIINFLIVAFSIFLLVRSVNLRLRSGRAAAATTVKTDRLGSRSLQEKCVSDADRRIRWRGAGRMSARRHLK